MENVRGNEQGEGHLNRFVEPLFRYFVNTESESSRIPALKDANLQIIFLAPSLINDPKMDGIRLFFISQPSLSIFLDIITNKFLFNRPNILCPNVHFHANIFLKIFFLSLHSMLTGGFFLSPFLLLFSLPLFIPLHSSHGGAAGPAGSVFGQQIASGEMAKNNNDSRRFSAELFGIPLSIHSQFHLLTNLKNIQFGQSMPIIQPLNAFFEQFFALTNSIDKAQWEVGLPTELERRQMRKLILFLFQLNDFGPIAANSTFLVQFSPILAKSIKLTFIQNYFCIVHELLPPSPSGRFRRFWGYFVLKCRGCHSPIGPIIHHSAPHFQSDGNVCNEAASIFEQTNSRSLVIAGASRFAVRGKYSSPCQPKNALADSAHNNQTMFHTICTSLLDASKIDGDDHIFMQWHGMAESSANSSAFLSVGVDGTHPIYSESNSSVNRLVSAVNGIAGERVASTPAEDKSCRLIASNNVFGRIVNGAPLRQSCLVPAKPKNINGQFIHIEQKREIRDNWSIWSNAINHAFRRTNNIDDNEEIYLLNYENNK